MPGQKISTLAPVSDLQANDQFVLSRSGSTYKIAGSLFASQAELDARTALNGTTYATKTQLTNYLPISGGAVTGPTSIVNTSSTLAAPTLTLSRSYDNGYVLRVNDTGGSDLSPFAVDANGHLLVSCLSAKDAATLGVTLGTGVTKSNFLTTLSAQGNDSGLYIQSVNGVPLYIEDAAGDQNPFIVDKDGKVGIGTKTPNQMLTVKGGISATGNIYVNGSSTSIGSSFVPTGAVMHFAKKTPPAGWIECNGATLSASMGPSYTALRNSLIDDDYPFGRTGNDPKVPDLRGKFVRAHGSSDGYDSTGNLGRLQADAFQSHTHEYTNKTDTFNGVGGGSNNNDTWKGVNNTQSTHATGDTETRPVNVSLLACIKL